MNSAQNPTVLRHPNGDPFSLTNRFRGGDTVTNTVGILGYDYSLYRVYPTGPATYTAANPRPAAPQSVGGTLRLASMSTMNYFLTGDDADVCGPAQDMECRGWDVDQPGEFARQRDKLLAALSGLEADIIGLTEVENTTGVEPLADLVAGLSGYAYVDTGTIGTDAIRVGLLYRTAKVTPVGAFQVLDSSDDPRFLDTSNRPTLAQTFQDNATGERFTVAVNHFKSKGSACSGDPDTGDGQGNCNLTRTDAAKALVDWLATDPTGSGDPDFLILGDLNCVRPGGSDRRGQGRPGRQPRDRGRLHEPDREVPGPVRILVPVRRAGRLPRPRAEQPRSHSPGDGCDAVAHQLRRAGCVRLRHLVQAAGPGSALRGQRLPVVRPRSGAGRARQYGRPWRADRAGRDPGINRSSCPGPPRGYGGARSAATGSTPRPVTGRGRSLPRTPAAPPPATVTGLTNGTEYRFRVAAINAAGTGPASTATDPLTPRTTPPPVKQTQIGPRPRSGSRSAGSQC